MHDINHIRNKILQLEEEGRDLEIGPAKRRELNEKVREYAEEFLMTLSNQKAYNKQGYDVPGWEEAFAVGEGKEDMGTLLDVLNKYVDHSGLNPASGGHLGYIPGGGLYGSALGDYLAAITNRYAGVFYASPGAVRIENSLINWAGRLVGYRGKFGGNLTSGGSFANLIALSTARMAMKVKSKDFNRAVIYVNRQTHHSVQKAIRIAGMEDCIIRILKCDEHYHMQPGELQEQIRNDKQSGLFPFLIIANAGSTDSGAVDPLDEIADIAEQEKIWFHVDAAYGGFFLLTQEGREKMKGIERADSVILDPHKGLFIPYGLGMVLVKDIHHLLHANDFEANYMQDARAYSFEVSPAELSPELSKHFRGLRLWIPLKLHGIAPFKACLEEKLWLARYFYNKVRLLGFETGPYPELSIVVFRMIPEEGDANTFNELLIKKIQEEGSVFISSTMMEGQFMLRFAVLSFRTHMEITDRLLMLLEKYVKEVSAESGILVKSSI